MNPSKPKIINFFEFIYDRHSIYYNRFILKKKSPWTTDPILNKVRFCNVYRELDKCSIHLIENVINNKKLSLDDKIFNIILYRRFNTPNFFDYFGVQTIKKYNWKSLEKKMDNLKKKDIRLFNSAYIICQRFVTSKYRKSDKHVQQLLLMEGLRKRWDQFCFHVLKHGGNSIETLHETFVEKIPMTGDFLAFQYCTDITYIPELKHCFCDLNDFVAMGPGSKPGIKLLFPSRIKSRNGPEFAQLCKLLYVMQIDFFNELASNYGKNFYRIEYKSPYFRKTKGTPAVLSLSNIQNCLCEFRKYCHLQTNPNKKKRYYRGGN